MDIDKTEAQAHELKGLYQAQNLILAGNACPGQVMDPAQGARAVRKIAAG